ncbi:hypothetical protein [Clostridium chrysemydis]|uniref:hypothetical protein n=1 Tax=Clostridium chrysemydis TaxID=2665504 RepID=UPI001EE554CB|nr:hypothetical protein [Clostridium chrysemydis]
MINKFFKNNDNKKFKFLFKDLRYLNKHVLFSMLFLASFGILNIYLATKWTENPTFYVIKQALWFLVSLISLYFY